MKVKLGFMFGQRIEFDYAGEHFGGIPRFLEWDGEGWLMTVAVGQGLRVFDLARIVISHAVDEQLKRMVETVPPLSKERLKEMTEQLNDEIAKAEKLN